MASALVHEGCSGLTRGPLLRPVSRAGTSRSSDCASAHGEVCDAAQASRSDGPWGPFSAMRADGNVDCGESQVAGPLSDRSVEEDWSPRSESGDRDYSSETSQILNIDSSRD